MTQARALVTEADRSPPPRWVVWKDLEKYRHWHAFLQDPYLNEARKAGVDPYIRDLRRKKDVLAEIEIRDAKIAGRTR